jgi:hypothetical protein
LKEVAHNVFPDALAVTYQEFLGSSDSGKAHAVLLGQGSGREVSAGSMSLDWVIARVEGGRLTNFMAVEVQSIDITGNYRACWESHRDARLQVGSHIKPGAFGLNWANVHKRIIPQILRKSLIVQGSGVSTKGLGLVVPEEVFLRFEPVIEFSTMPTVAHPTKDSITIRTVALGPSCGAGRHRQIAPVRTFTVKHKDLAERFIRYDGGNPDLPIDRAVAQALGCKY